MAEKIKASSRCIIALDLPGYAEALALADTLGDAASFYKVGLELFAGGDGRKLLETLVGRGKQVFADLKLYDVPETVARATRQIAVSGADFLTVHGDTAIMQAAVANKGGRLKILAVTALTSLDDKGLQQLGYRGSMADFVLERAAQAQAAGCDGVICSGLEVALLRQRLGNDFLLVTPGIRLPGSAADDQKRIAAPAAVIQAGGDYLVVGRPIRDAASPPRALVAIISDMQAAFDRR